MVGVRYENWMSIAELLVWLFVTELLIWFAGALFGVGLLWALLVEARHSRERCRR